MTQLITECPPTDRRVVEEIARQLSRRKLEFYRPYPRQQEFHEAGSITGIRERALVAANQVGKTTAAAMETAIHLTGRYPDWWRGRRFSRPVVFWCGSNTGETTRDNAQRLLLGRPGEWGSGAIPGKAILEIKRNPHGVPDQVSTILVEHGPTKRPSTITLKSYDQGREKWQGETLDGVWCDEEPSMDVYIEGLTRTNASQGMVYLTLTPRLGMSEVVRRFLVEKVPGTHFVNMALDDAKHFTPEQQIAIAASYPEYERDARVKGLPSLGSGRVFQISEDWIAEAPLVIPPFWPRLVGLDIGWDHPTAAVWLAWDRDTDTVHVYDAYRAKQMSIILHAAAIKARGAWIPVAWPHDALQHDTGGSCEQIAQQYRQQGVMMLATHATHPAAFGQEEGSGGYSTEAGVQDLLVRMQTGRLKVAKHLNDWFEEFRLYHRQNGQIVKIGDDLMSATRIGVMMLRRAIVQTPERKPRVPAFQADPVMGVFGSMGGAVIILAMMSMALC